MQRLLPEKVMHDVNEQVCANKHMQRLLRRVMHEEGKHQATVDVQKSSKNRSRSRRRIRHLLISDIMTHKIAQDGTKLAPKMAPKDPKVAPRVRMCTRICRTPTGETWPQEGPT